MAARSQIFISVAATAILAILASAQEPQKVTIAEPGIYELSGLFKHSDTVALVRVVAADAETYGVPIYKAEVVKNFKGTADGETIYFGPFLGEKLGWQYILFLRNTAKPIAPKATQKGGFGRVHYSEVFNEGYTSMMTSYECVFDGKDIPQQCDHGVRICTDYIKLPKATPTFPPMTDDPPFGCRWVRESAFVSLLETFVTPNK